MTTKLAHIGPKTTAQLRQVGVHTLDDLRAVGPVQAFVRMKRAGFKTSLNALYAFAGALSDRHWAALDEAEKAALTEAANAELAFLGQPRNRVMPVRDVPVDAEGGYGETAPDAEGYDDGPPAEPERAPDA